MKNKLSYIWYYYKKFGWLIFFTKKIPSLKKIIPQKCFIRITKKRHDAIERKIRTIANNYNDISLDISINHNNDKIIWFCWLQGFDNMPLIVKACYNSIIRNNKYYNIKFISFANYQEYVSLPDYISNLYHNGSIKNAHFADIIRTFLLYKYGGLWIDATIYVNNTIPDYYNYKFYSLRLNSNPIYVSDCRWCNFYLFGNPGNKVMELTLKLFYSYLKNEPIFIDYFMMDYFIDIAYKDNNEVKECIDKILPIKYDIYILNKVLNSPVLENNKNILSIPLNKLHWKDNFTDNINSLKTFYKEITENENN